MSDPICVFTFASGNEASLQISIELSGRACVEHLDQFMQDCKRAVEAHIVAAFTRGAARAFLEEASNDSQESQDDLLDDLREPLERVNVGMDMVSLGLQARGIQVRAYDPGR